MFFAMQVLTKGKIVQLQHLPYIPNPLALSGIFILLAKLKIQCCSFKKRVLDVFRLIENSLEYLLIGLFV